MRNAGRRIFASSCAPCHGLDGLGSERAPNVVTNPQVQRLSETQISRIISDGVPGKGMPAFRTLGAAGVKSVIGYLSGLQGKEGSAPLAGDPQRGKTIFFGNGGCSACHMIGGTGGFIGPDLSAYAHTHRAKKIRSAIVASSESHSAKSMVTAIAVDGRRYQGVVRNEDNFSLQLQSIDGTFHFFSKANLTAIERGSTSIMTSDYDKKLSADQLNDLVSYLLSIAKNSKPRPARGEDLK
jgi:cytochrome c oxidase cbb3-type subunit III